MTTDTKTDRGPNETAWLDLCAELGENPDLNTAYLAAYTTNQRLNSGFDGIAHMGSVAAWERLFGYALSHYRTLVANRVDRETHAVMIVYCHKPEHRGAGTGAHEKTPECLYPREVGPVVKIVHQADINTMRDDQLAELLIDSGPLSPGTRERAELEQMRREEMRRCNANTAIS